MLVLVKHFVKPTHFSFNKCLKAFILHAGLWGVYKRFCFGYTTNKKKLISHMSASSGWNFFVL